LNESLKNFADADAGFMRRAMALAARGRGNVEPNPMVGAVVVRGGKIVGEGYHRRFGGPHAEVFALSAAGARAKGATLYVTLEPCCHWGKTPPCTDAIVAAGVSRVVAAMIDPFAKVRGQGVALLRKRGVRVEVGLLEAEARRLNAAFIMRLKQNRPYVIAKWAQSVDGKIATASGESRWISGEESREWVQRARGIVDGIVVGIGTALVDDPLLMARPSRARHIRRIATRIVLDSECRLETGSQLVRTVAHAPVMVVHGAKLGAAAARRKRALEGRGVVTLGVPSGRAGLDLRALLHHLAWQEYSNILVEGGSEVMAGFFAAKMVDEAHVFIAPKVIGGKGAPSPVGGAGIGKLAAAQAMTLVGMERSGEDVHLTLLRG
jgi:diaminohydroxyphosphoribosylaminopyrimidine deaminase/5-amino-6-(5-phosphoribosylamino)uracil reductase